jgi:UDP-glucuronate 4-epimerase
MLKNFRVLVTGSAGFIGSAVTQRLLSSDFAVLGVDNYADYYHLEMKSLRAKQLQVDHVTSRIDLADYPVLRQKFEEFRPNVVVHLAAQAGVRASQEDPLPYLVSNQLGFFNLLDLCSKFQVERLIFASSSSVYGEQAVTPFKEDAVLGSPKSLYALSKLSNEIMSRDWPRGDMSILALRLFTVYGPWGRPDMAMFRLLASSRLGIPFKLSASLHLERDFTFVSDVVDVIEKASSPEFSLEGFNIVNVAGGHPYSLGELFNLLEARAVRIQLEPISTSSLDVQVTHASNEKLNAIGLPVPSTTLDVGVHHTIDWMQTISLDDIEQWYDYSSPS